MRTRVLRRLMTALVAVATLLTFAPVALAGTQTHNCAPDRVVAATLWENSVGDTSDGDDILKICVSPATANNYDILTRFPDVPHILPTACNNSNLGSGTWNDCIDSAQVAVGYRVCLYSHSSPLTQYKIFEHTTSSRLPVSPRDVASSIIITKAFNGCANMPLVDN